EIFGKWHRLGKSKKDALKKRININKANILRILKQEKDKTFPQLGSLIMFWNGLDAEKSARVSLNLCAYGKEDVVKNSIVIDLPSSSNKKYYKLVSMITKYWNPQEILINAKPIEEFFNDNDDNEISTTS
ncbi:MAG: hypothetical protein GXO27_05730, partial [Chlorobi bacterium]|nr:hypothetical protein [Chlorobiota bacterium]